MVHWIVVNGVLNVVARVGSATVMAR